MGQDMCDPCKRSLTKKRVKVHDTDSRCCRRLMTMRNEYKNTHGKRSISTTNMHTGAHTYAGAQP